MTLPNKIFVIFLVQNFLGRNVFSFVQHRHHPDSALLMRQPLQMTSEGNGDEIESMRRRLEETLGNGESSSFDESTMSRGNNKNMRLSTTARERKKHEIELLEGLSDSDEPLNELWALWFVEKGPAPASQLLSTQDLFQRLEPGPGKDQGRKADYIEAEDMLRKIIHEQGRDWVEPINRLATLYYLQGKFKESIAMCELVLDVKPWHFGCLSGITLCYAELGDRVNARMWASRRLPPLEASERRREWVERACAEARQNLARGSGKPLESFAKEDFVAGSDIPQQSDDWNIDGVGNDDAWQ